MSIFDETLVRCAIHIWAYATIGVGIVCVLAIFVSVIKGIIER